MAKILKPDLSKPCMLCRFEISILIPENKSNSFNQHITEMIKDIKEVFGSFNTFFVRMNERAERPDVMRIELLAGNDDYFYCDKFFKEKVPIWKQQLGLEKLLY